MLRRLVLASTTQPVSPPVPGEASQAYLDEVGEWKAARRALSRRLGFWLSGQQRFELPAMPAQAKRVLWIYFGENQVGDALMDLASRSLLAEAGLQVDLFASPLVAGLFDGDPWLVRSSSDPAAFDGVAYDCAIVLSNKRRPLEPKLRHFPRLPWVSLHGYFTGPNFHRGALAARRLADLLGRDLGEPDLWRHARPKLGPLAQLPAAIGAAPSEVALVLGGVRDDRIYRHWEAVMRQLLAAGHSRFAFVGSSNASSQAQSLADALPAASMRDFTGRLSLAQTRAVLEEASVVACPDGGLMHLALTVGTPIVPLFSAQIAPEWRLPPELARQALRADSGGVSSIPPEAVSAAILRLLARRADGFTGA